MIKFVNRELAKKPDWVSRAENGMELLKNEVSKRIITWTNLLSKKTAFAS